MKTNNSIQELVQNTDKSFTLHITIPQNIIEAQYKKILEQVAPKIKIAGFRPGKAPTDVLEQHVNEEEILKEVITSVISAQYTDLLKKHNLKPIIEPHVKLLTAPVTTKTDWEVEYMACEQPEVKIDETSYAEIKKLDKKSEKIVDEMVDILLKNTTLSLPQVLIDHDLTYHMEQNPTADKTAVASKIEKDWKTNFIIDQIGKDQKITVTESDIKPVIENNPALAQNINLLYYLVYQQKVLDYLKNLI